MQDSEKQGGYGYGDFQANQMVEESSFDIRILWYLLLRYKWWILASIIACLAIAKVYLKFQTPIYSVSSKMLIKDQERRYSSSISSTFSELGLKNNSAGFDNEVEVLATRTLNKRVVKELKLYTTYMQEGRLKDNEIYNKYVPFLVDYDNELLDSLDSTIEVEMQTDDQNNLQVAIRYYESEIHKVLTAFPSIIKCSFGDIRVEKNPLLMFSRYAQNNKDYNPYIVQRPIHAYIRPLAPMAGSYAGRLRITPTSKSTSIALISMVDNIPERARDYLMRLGDVYNDDANIDNLA